MLQPYPRDPNRKSRSNSQLLAYVHEGHSAIEYILYKVIAIQVEYDSVREQRLHLLVFDHHTLRQF